MSTDARKYRVYEIYRQLGLSWKEFQAKSRAHGWNFYSPHHKLADTLADEVMAAFSFVPVDELPELLAQLRVQLQKLPDASAGRRMVTLIRTFSFADDKERQFVVDYVSEHVLGAWPGWPKRGVFDWEKVEATPYLWAMLDRVLDGGEADESPIALLYDTHMYFQPRAGFEAEPALVERLQDESYLIDDLWVCDDDVEGWAEILCGLGFWDHPEHHERCRAWLQALEQAPTIDGWHRFGRLRSLWAMYEPTHLVALAFDQHERQWEAALAPLQEQFFEELVLLSDRFTRQAHYSGLVIRKIKRKRKPFSLSEQSEEAKGFYLNSLVPACKRLLSVHLSGEEKKSLRLTIHFQREQALGRALDDLEGAIRELYEESQRDAHIQLLHNGFSLPGVTVFELATDRELTCCGSSQYLVECPQGYYLVQSYRFC